MRVQAATEWASQAALIYEGDFSKRSDRKQLVDPLLGLWAKTLQMCKKREEHEEGVREREVGVCVDARGAECDALVERDDEHLRGQP